MQAFRSLYVASRAPVVGASAARRAFATSSARFAGKESNIHGGSDHAEHLDSLKKKQQEDAKKGTNTWTEGLASDSEANVKADNENGHKTPEQLQKETAGKVGKS